MRGVRPTLTRPLLSDGLSRIFSEKALALAWFLCNQPTESQANYVHAVTHGFSDEFLETEVEYDAKLAMEEEYSSCRSLPIFFIAAKTAKVHYFGSLVMEVSVLDEEFIKSDRYETFCAAVMHVDCELKDVDCDLISRVTFHRYPPIGVPLPAATRPTSDTSATDDISLEAVQIFGPFKEEYFYIASSCESYLRVLEDFAWKRESRRRQVMVSFHSSMKGARLLKSDRADSGHIDNRLRERLCKKGWQADECNISPPENTSWIVLVSLPEHFEYHLKRLKDLLVHQFQLPLDDKPTGTLNLSSTLQRASIDIPDDQNALVVYVREQMKADVNEYRRVLLADNYLEWGINGKFIDAIVKKNSETIEHLDLSENAFTSDEFIVWYVFFLFIMSTRFIYIHANT